MIEKAVISQNGDINEIINQIINPKLIIFMTTKENFTKHTKEIAQNFIGIPSIGCIAMSYAAEKICEHGLTVISFSDNIDVAVNVIEDLDKYPIKYIKKLKNDISKINASASNTICLDICTGYDGKLVTTLNTVLSEKNISLCGGTSDNNTISINGTIYHNACGYALIKNLKGKIKVYKENIYSPTEKRYIATKVDSENNLIYEINNEYAKDLYMKELNITEKDVSTQTFKNPLGRIYGNEVYLISISDIKEKALHCYKQVNLMDVLTIMKLDNYKETINNTLKKIKNDMPNVTSIFSINCLFRYLLFKNENYFNDYLKSMNSLAYHAGFIGLGEHYCTQHINQTACIIAFE